MRRRDKEGITVVTATAIIAEFLAGVIAPSRADAASNERYFKDQFMPPVKNNLVVPLDEEGRPVFEQSRVSKNNDEEGETGESPVPAETEQQASSRLYVIPQVEIDDATWTDLLSLIPEDQRERFLAQDSIAFSFSFEVGGPETRPDASSFFPNNPDLATHTQALIDLVYQQNGTPGVYEISLLVDHQTDDGSIKGSPTLRTTIPEVALGAETFSAGTHISISESGSFHWLEPGVFDFGDGSVIDIRRVVVSPVSAIAEVLAQYGIAVPEDEDAAVMVGVDALDRIAVVITESQAVRLEPLAQMEITTTTNVRSAPSTSAEQVGQKQAGDVVTLATYDRVVAIMGGNAPEGLARDPDMNTAYVNDGQYVWYPELAQNDQGQATIHWIARLSNTTISATATPTAPDSGLVMASYSRESGDLEAVAPVVPESSGMNALNTNWIELARTNPEALRTMDLPPEFEAALANERYFQLGYLSEGETGTFIPIPLALNPTEGPIRRATLQNRYNVEYYYLSNTPLTPGIYENVVIPSLEAMYQQRLPELREMPQPPFYVVNFYDYDQRNSMPGRKVQTQGSVFISADYHADTNVMEVNIAWEATYGYSGIDVPSLVQSAIAGAMTGDKLSPIVDQYNWALAITNPMLGNESVGTRLFSDNNAIAEALKELPDLQLTYPHDDQNIPAQTFKQ